MATLAYTVCLPTDKNLSIGDKISFWNVQFIILIKSTLGAEQRIMATIPIHHSHKESTQGEKGQRILYQIVTYT